MKQIVEQFCTPPSIPFSEFEKKEFTEFNRFEVSFNGSALKCLSIGKGKNVLIAHGWGSRAGHFFLMAKYISNAGFRCILFDAPAHFSYGYTPEKQKSSMFEFGQALSTITAHLENVYAIVGHSLGAIASVFSASGYLRFEDFKLNANKLVLISCPSSLERIIQSFCNRFDLSKDKYEELWRGLEEEFKFKVNDYQLSSAFSTINSKIMLVHDKDDKDIPMDDFLLLKSSCNPDKIFISNGFGHDRIIINKQMILEIIDYLQSED